MNRNEKEIIRELAKKCRDISNDPVMDKRRDLWRKHNSLKPTRPLVLVHWGGADTLGPELVCQNPIPRSLEGRFRNTLFQYTCEDDRVFEPWITISASYIQPEKGPWGIESGVIESHDEFGAYKIDPSLKEEQDLYKMTVAPHLIDEEKTSEIYEQVHDIIGDIIEIKVDRSPFFKKWNADISTVIGRLRGLDQLMMDMYDRPEWLHQLLAIIRDGIMEAQDKAEIEGDWRFEQSNQAMGYSEELPAPWCTDNPAQRKDLWNFIAAQEYTLISPEMHDEFLLQYQLPIMEKFGLVAYGCCEDLTKKIDMLRKIPNLRRIAVTPVADVRKCAEQINKDYVLSWRPNPADVCVNFNPEHIKKIIRQGLESAKDCHVDITLKDIHTVQGEPDRIIKWVKIVREVIDDVH